MPFPPHTDLQIESISTVAEHHGLPAHPITRLPDTGIFNAVYLVGENHILRIPRRHPAHYRALHSESIAVPLARAAGVRTPALLAYDDSGSLLPVPYTIYERVRGETLSQLDLEPEESPDVWRELGRDLARLHVGVDRGGPGAALDEREMLPDPRALAEELAADGWITGSEVRWLSRWLDRVAATCRAPAESRLCHGDSQTSNVMVAPNSHQYIAVIDWGSAGWGDSAWDFAGIPLRAVPCLLEGHREIAPVHLDDMVEARILWRHIQLALLTAQRGPQLDRSWAERPLTMLIEVTRFFFSEPPGPWRDLRPD